MKFFKAQIEKREVVFAAEDVIKASEFIQSSFKQENNIKIFEIELKEKQKFKIGNSIFVITKIKDNCVSFFSRDTGSVGKIDISLCPIELD